MNNQKKCTVFLKIASVLGVFSMFFAASTLTAYAVTPAVSLNLLGANNNVGATIYGDPNSQVTLYSTQSSQIGQNFGAQNLGAQNLGVIGMTSSNSYLYTTLNPSSYNIAVGSYVYVSVNGQNSPSVMWPYNAYNYNNNYYPYAPASSYSALSFSSNTISLVQGQSATGQVLGGNTQASYYVSNNSNSFVVSTSMNGSMINLYALAPGNSVITVCQNGVSCATLTVTVQGNYYATTPYVYPNYSNYPSNQNYQNYQNYNYPTYSAPIMQPVAQPAVYVPQYNLPATVINSWRWW